MTAAWCRDSMDKAVEGFRRRVKAPQPMVAVPDLSPEFLGLAIRLDVALCEYRDKFGGVKLLERLHRRRFGAWDDYAMPTPPLERVDTAAEKAQHAVHEAISAIETAKTVTKGDRTLKRRASDLRMCPRYRQLDWLFEVEHQDYEERACATNSAAESS